MRQFKTALDGTYGARLERVAVCGLRARGVARPESDDSLAKAYGGLAGACKILAIPLEKIAARPAYLAAFHAAKAYVLEHAGKVAKTHSGVRTELARLLRKHHGAKDKNHGAKDKDLTAFLAKAYAYKELSDYSSALDKAVTAREAAETVEPALRFAGRIRTLLSEPG